MTHYRSENVLVGKSTGGDLVSKGAGVSVHGPHAAIISPLVGSFLFVVFVGVVALSFGVGMAGGLKGDCAPSVSGGAR